MEHFFKNKNKTATGKILVFFVVIILSLIVFTLCWMGISEFFSLDIGLAAILAVIPTIIAALLFSKFFLNGIDYIVTEKELKFLKKGKVIKNFPYENCQISSLVTNMSYSGVPSGKIRQVVIDDGKKKKTYVIGLNKKNFNEFMSLVSSYSARTGNNSEINKAGEN